jgi:hypothetical protein
MTSQPQTLDVGEYFTFSDVHKGGYYKVLAKTGNIYFVWCNLKLEPGCHGMFMECPFPERTKDCETEPDTKVVLENDPNYGGCHYTCMIINPEKVTKVATLRGLLDNPYSANIK